MISYVTSLFVNFWLHICNRTSLQSTMFSTDIEWKSCSRKMTILDLWGISFHAVLDCAWLEVEILTDRGIFWSLMCRYWPENARFQDMVYHYYIKEFECQSVLRTISLIFNKMVTKTERDFLTLITCNTVFAICMLKNEFILILDR